MRPDTISAIGTFTALSPDAGAHLRIDPGACAGYDDAPLRTTVEDRQGVDGALIFPPLDGAQIITLAGAVVIEDADDDDDYLDQVDELISDLKTALDLMKAAPDDLTHAGGSLSVWKHAPVERTWQQTVAFVTFSVVVDVT